MEQLIDEPYVIHTGHWVSACFYFENCDYVQVANAEAWFIRLHVKASLV